MTSPFSGTQKRDRRGRSGLNMVVYKRSGDFQGREVSVDTIKNMLVGSTISYMVFGDCRMEICIETPDGEVYNIVSGTEQVYIENGCYDEWECYLEEGDDEWQEDQRKQIRASNEYMEQRRRRYPND